MPRRSKYPQEWGQGIVNLFLERHARGTDYYLKHTGFTRKQLGSCANSLLCSGNSKAWEAFKANIKAYDGDGFPINAPDSD